MAVGYSREDKSYKQLPFTNELFLSLTHFAYRRKPLVSWVASKINVLMKLNSRSRYLAAVVAILVSVSAAQIEPAEQQTVAAPVPYASLSQVTSLLAQLEQQSQATQIDLAKLRIDRWKTDSTSKRQAQSNVESVTRNLHDALPGIMGELRAAPESLVSTFKLYRNLDALYDVLGSVVESTGAFGSKDEFQKLANDLTAIEGSRRSFADRMETLAGTKEVELTKLRTQIHSAQQASVPTTTKKVVVDDTDTPKKPVKKAVPKPPSASNKPAAGAPAPATPPKTQ